MEIIYACNILFHALLCKASALHNTRHGVIVSSEGQDARSIRHPAIAIQAVLATMRAAPTDWTKSARKKPSGPNTTIPTAKPMPASFGREPERATATPNRTRLIVKSKSAGRAVAFSAVP